MVKDDLTAFQDALNAYNKSSRYEALKQFFSRVPNPILHGFWFSFAVVMLFAIAMGIVLFVLVDKGQKDLLLYAIMGFLSIIMLFHFYLIKHYDLEKEKLQPYRELLTRTFYQVERYLLFKETLNETYSHNPFPYESVKSLVQLRLQLNEGLLVFRVWLLGISASILVTVLYGLTPSGESEKLAYIAVISFFLLLVLFYAYFVHDPLWFKNNKYRELLLFITIYESDAITEDRT